MNTLAKIVQLIADIGECDELNMTLESVVINLTNLKSVLSQPKKEVSELVLVEPETDEEEPETDEEDNVKLKTLYLRKKVILDLQSNFDRPRDWFAIVLLELKQKMKTHTIKMTARMYEYHYVLPTHPRVVYYFDYYDATNPRHKKEYKIQYSIRHYADHPVVKYLIQSNLRKGEDASSLLDDWERMRDITNRIHSHKSVPDEIKPYLIRVRMSIGTMDLRQTPTPYSSILNLKPWDKATKKTSNKGLKADTTYNWTTDYGSTKGWKFGGISAGSLAGICKKNGLIEEKKKKYQYGDYAEWYMKL
jgi:hypothetical protein